MATSKNFNHFYSHGGKVQAVFVLNKTVGVMGGGGGGCWR